MAAVGITGIALSRAYWAELVAPLLTARLPDVPVAAGRLGTGSDVLGLDDATSRDHDWGLRLTLVVPAGAATRVDRLLDEALPGSFCGLPVRFPFTGETAARHHVEVTDLSGLLVPRLGFDTRSGIGTTDWLSLTGQAVLEVTAGPLFADPTGEVEAARRALAWYPDDVWRHVVRCDWARVAQELPLLGRAFDVGDTIGGRLIAARIVHVVLHLAFLLERRWAPYAKWFGTASGALASADALRPLLVDALDAVDPATRHRALAAALQHLLEAQNALGLTAVPAATVPFWDRPHLQPDPAIVAQLGAGISDPRIHALPVGRGSIEQRTDNVDVLVDPAARRRAVLD